MARYPYRGKLLLNRQGKKNTKYNVALCDRDEEVEFLQVEGAAQMLSGIVGEYDAKHLSRIESEIKAAGGGQYYKIQGMRFDTLMAKHHDTTEIDYLSIDVEGGGRSLKS
ncbi:FkbM family methyltransferase [uncultured Helicobacter sp.]|uniref:FkbM family methyltransferase n=1 Tax=uncultured Helicobacter sp. TaxID=175537 RepID=UPI00261376FF|nr:FkbM family methyltransferase [uncultured Helicobacter sp.]